MIDPCLEFEASGINKYVTEPFLVEALYDFVAESKDEISLKPGQKIKVMQIGGRDGVDGWWFGRIYGELSESVPNTAGWFPANFVQIT